MTCSRVTWRRISLPEGLKNMREVRCIICPIGCMVRIELENGEVRKISGNQCIRGREYAVEECLDPKRIVCSSILVSGGEWPLVSVRTSKPVSKEKLFLVMEEVRNAKVKAPVTTGDVLIRNVATTSVDIIATKDVPSR